GRLQELPQRLRHPLPQEGDAEHVTGVTDRVGVVALPVGGCPGGQVGDVAILLPFQDGVGISQHLVNPCGQTHAGSPPADFPAAPPSPHTLRCPPAGARPQGSPWPRRAVPSRRRWPGASPRPCPCRPTAFRPPAPPCAAEARPPAPGTSGHAAAGGPSSRTCP